MQLTFEFWGALRKAAGGDEHSLTLEGPSTVADALAALAESLPALREQLDSTAVADADRLLLRTDAVADGMRLALLPPVAGG